MPTLYLHCGHHKTGSSYIQSSLALSILQLSNHGKSYSIADGRKRKAIDGEVTYGNFHPVNDSFSMHLQKEGSKKCEDVIVSNEGLFEQIFRSRLCMELWELQEKKEISAVKILLFIRDPLDQALSRYKQDVKYGGCINGPEKFLAEYNLPQNVRNFVKTARDYGFEITVKNYSLHQESLLLVVEEWLGVPTETLKRPPYSKVNRSLTRSELALQQAFNKYYGKASAAFVSDPLINVLSDEPVDHPSVYFSDIREFLDRMQQELVLTKGLWEEDEMYRVPRADDVRELFRPDRDNRFCFTERQLDTFVQAISKRLKSM